MQKLQYIVFQNLLFVVTLFCFSTPVVHAQISNETFKSTDSKLKKGEELQINFESIRDGNIKDTGRWKNKAIDDNTIEVDFLIEHTSNLNPYKAEYKYNIELLDGGAFQIDMTAALDPMTLRLADDYTIEYEGDPIFFPANVQGLKTLPAATGLFSVLQPTGEKLLEYEVKVTNRKVQLVEVNGIEGLVYQHTYDLHFQNRLNNGSVIVETHEQVEEVLSPYTGMMSQSRTADIRVATDTDQEKNRKKEVNTQMKIEIKSIIKK